MGAASDIGIHRKTLFLQIWKKMMRLRQWAMKKEENGPGRNFNSYIKTSSENVKVPVATLFCDAPIRFALIYIDL
ncbi:hypothetical protein MXB_1924 [Myxobolus squamalis]|nr:hypothetical protein MXB_1924 [Myxobolus squamalis]